MSRLFELIEIAQFNFEKKYRFIALLTNPFYIMRKNLYIYIKKYAPRLEGTILDFGCGSKPYKHLFTNCTEYIGVDIYNEGHSHDKDEIEFFYDGKKLPFEDNSFDNVFSSEVIEHIDNLDEILDEIYRVLKPGGLFLLTTPFVWNENELPHDYARYTSCGLAKLLDRHNFEVIEYTKSCNFIEILYQMKAEYYRHRYSKRPVFIRRLAQLSLICSESFKGDIFGKLLPSNDSLYGNNIFVCKKS